MELKRGFENGDVEIREYELPDGEIRWWIRVGQAMLELDGERMTQLLELTEAYVSEGFDDDEA